jgi:4-amino-4-deoxy-L-arabinose transferase-like glycosyltransferase
MAKKQLKSLARFKTFLLILLIVAGLFLRFYDLKRLMPFGWDQARDAWAMKEMLADKKLPLIGPRTGIGHFHLGPAYYYLLAPFYFLTDLDPIGSGYFSIFASLLTIVSIFWVAQEVFGIKVAYLSAFIYAFCRYLILMDRVPWNVSLVMAASVWIFYTLFKIDGGNSRWFIPLGLLAGFFFHLHFTAVFIPPIVMLSLLFIKNKKKMIPWGLAAVLAFALFFIPNIIHEVQSGLTNYYKFQEFLRCYYHGFHFRFMIYRLKDALIMIDAVLFFGSLKFLKYILPIIFGILFIVFPQNKRSRFIGLVIFFWFLVTLVGFTLYSGPLSDYYFLLTMPLAIYLVSWLTIWVFRLRFKPLAILLVLFWLFWAYRNMATLMTDLPRGGLIKDRQVVIETINKGEKIEFSESMIQSYLYYIYTRK